MIKILVVFGTRPEAVKMCPLVKELKKYKEINCKVCLTGQHKEMLAQVMETFEVEADYNLNIMKPNQSLTTITVEVLNGLNEIFAKELPNIVLVHGDTTTSLATALSAFYHGILVGHVEAGLRTYNKYSPFPEEINRTLISKIADIHFAPTESNRINLIKENITKSIFVTGNTGLDAFQTTVVPNYKFHNSVLNTINFETYKIILVTAHRRENIGVPIENICKAVKMIVENNKDVVVVYPMHLNPAVRESVMMILGNLERIYLTEPLDVRDMHNLIDHSYLVMTDSGGLQEEAPSRGKPVLVMRKETERPEAVEAGTIKVVGTEKENIYKEASILLKESEKYERMAKAVNPYGDGYASKRIGEILMNLLL